MDIETVNKKYIILDFDGTMCLLFQNYDLESTCRRLRRELAKYSIDFPEGADAFDAFGAVTARTQEEETLRERALRTVNEILTEAETEAADTGIPVTGVKEAVDFWKQNGYRVGIATNNSEESVRKFLQRISVEGDFPIVGRIGTHPEMMKPDPWSVIEVLGLLGGTAEEAVFIGDTARDLQCAERVGCSFAGMTPTERKRKRLGAVLEEDRMVRDYRELLEKYFM